MYIVLLYRYIYTYTNVYKCIYKDMYIYTCIWCIWTYLCALEKGIFSANLHLGPGGFCHWSVITQCSEVLHYRRQLEEWREKRLGPQLIFHRGVFWGHLLSSRKDDVLCWANGSVTVPPTFCDWGPKLRKKLWDHSLDCSSFLWKYVVGSILSAPDVSTDLFC